MPDDNPTGKPITRESVRPMSRSGGDLIALTVAAVANAVEKALTPGCFFLAPGCKLRVSHEPREAISRRDSLGTVRWASSGRN